MTDGPRTMNVGEARRRATRVDGDGNLTLWGARRNLLDLVTLEARTDVEHVERAGVEPADADLWAERLLHALDDLEDAVLRTHDAFGCDLDTEASGRYACRTCVERSDADPDVMRGYAAYHDLDDDDEVRVNEALREAARRRSDVLRERKQSNHDAYGRVRESGAVAWTDLKHRLGLCESSDDVARDEIIARIRSGVPEHQHRLDVVAARLARLEDVLMTTRAELRREGLLLGGDA